MDINLTGQVASTLVDNLKPPWYNPLINFGAGVVGGFVTGIITYYAVKNTNKSAEQREKLSNLEGRRKILKEKQWEIFRKLKGVQSLVSQDYFTYSSYCVGIFREQAIARLQTEEEERLIHLDEAKRYIAISNDFDRVFAKDRQELHELIGSIPLFFPNSEELNKVTIPIYAQVKLFGLEFNDAKLRNELNDLVPCITSDITTWQNAFDKRKTTEYYKLIEDWRYKKIDKATIFVNTIIFQQLDDLLHCLQQVILTEDKCDICSQFALKPGDEEIKKKGWWKFWK